MDPFVPVTSLRVAVPPPPGDNGNEGPFFLRGSGGRYGYSLASQVCEDSLWPKVPELSENLTKSISQGASGRNIPTISYPNLPHLRGIRLKTG